MEVVLVIEVLWRIMEKIYCDCGIIVVVEVDFMVKFWGECQDFEEMVGNFVDNVCKWVMFRVEIEVLVEILVQVGVGLWF